MRVRGLFCAFPIYALVLRVTTAQNLKNLCGSSVGSTSCAKYAFGFVPAALVLRRQQLFRPRVGMTTAVRNLNDHDGPDRKARMIAEPPELHAMTVRQLKDALRAQGLKTGGLKAELQARLAGNEHIVEVVATSSAKKKTEGGRTLSKQTGRGKLPNGSNSSRAVKQKVRKVKKQYQASEAGHALRPPTATASLPAASREQQTVSDAIGRGVCVAVTAVAGAGKTTCILQATAQHLDKRFVVVTYNRALKDECDKKVRELGLSKRVHVHTIHGLVSKCARKLCRNDHKLLAILEDWDQRPEAVNAWAFDVMVVDEAQDLRPSFKTAIDHVLQARSRITDTAVQLAVFGDPKQLLYDFATYGNDKATKDFLVDAEEHWAEHTKDRPWEQLALQQSFRLTYEIATFVNLYWGTRIIAAGKAESQVDYLCRMPFPSRAIEEKHKLDLQFFADLIDEHGPENVLLLAQSVKHEKSPIRVLVNELMLYEDDEGNRKYNFDVRGSLLEDSGGTDATNKVRVMTFCGAKGCEADAVVVFGFDLFSEDRVTPLNQIGVALSRARKRLVVVHGRQMDRTPLGFYPVLGDTVSANEAVSVDVGGEEWTLPPSVQERSHLAGSAIRRLPKQKVVQGDPHGIPKGTLQSQEGAAKEKVYAATDFTHFAAAVEARFLARARWWSEPPLDDTGSKFQSELQFEQTKEDVSAVYGTAVSFMLQWALDRFCPNVEALLSNSSLKVHPTALYNSAWVEAKIAELDLLPLSEPALAELRNATTPAVDGTELCKLLNSKISLHKTRELDDGSTAVFRVPAVRATEEVDQLLLEHLPRIRAAYTSEQKTEADWCYIANAVMAFDAYHEKFKQIGTDRRSYSEWVAGEALLEGLTRLQGLMQSRTASSEAPAWTRAEETGFEVRLMHRFNPIVSDTRNEHVVGVIGDCDWVGYGLCSPRGRPVDLLEIKFVSELTVGHRLQLLVYCALFAAERRRSCAGLLFNARTGEAHVCEVTDVDDATELLREVALFKCNGVLTDTPSEPDDSN